MSLIPEVNRNASIPRAALEKLFAAFVERSDFPCLGAKSAFSSGSYRVSAYERLADPFSSRRLAVDLTQFQESKLRAESAYATFVAIFHAPRLVSEETFEALLWSQLQQLHEIDRTRYEWDSSVSSNPSDSRFSFSFAGKAFYVIGMHPNSSRMARRFAFPAMIFNPHEQFERLRSEGHWRKMQATIRERDIALQGNINPMLSDFGETSEARQYSGRAVENNWRPPFRKSDSGASRCPFAH
jgi:uncharacterized protein